MASRPCISLTSSEELAGSSNAFPPAAITEVTVAIKPKAVRLRPVAYHSSEIQFNCDKSVSAASLSSDKGSIEISRENSESITFHRPIAKVVPAAAMLVNLEDYVDQQQILINENSQTQQLTQVNCNVQNQSAQKLHQRLTPLSNTNKLHCSSNSACMNNKSEVRAQQSISSGDRNSLDGYNWRKYGQKQVKGSEYPRGYYRCTHPGCPVKKMVERSQDGEISEIVYRGNHNHPKPQQVKHPSSSRLRGQAFVLHGNGRSFMDNSVINDSLIEETLFENKTEYCFNDGFLVTDSKRKAQFFDDSYMTTTSISLSFSPECKGVAFATMEGNETSSQIRKNDDKFMESIVAAKSAPFPKLVDSKEYDHATDDGYRWRKYGQKVVKGNSYPRSYYRCTNQTCSARKYVERDSDDPNSFVTTYEGEHNHYLPDEIP